MQWYDIFFTGGTRPHYESVKFILDDSAILTRGRELVRSFYEFIQAYDDGFIEDIIGTPESYFRIPWQETVVYCKHSEIAKGVVLFFDREKIWKRSTTGFYVYVLLEEGETLPNLELLDKGLYLRDTLD
jgi:hypothetical protein